MESTSLTTEKLKKIEYAPQIFGAAVICLSTFNQGALNGYTTIALPQWKNETNVELRFDDNESSLYASSIFMIGIICSPIGGILSGWLGRRRFVLIATPLVICGWLITGFAQNKIMLFVGRIISGGTVLSQSSAVPIYISETAHPNIRGSLVTLDAFVLATGYLSTWIISYFLTWRMTAYLLTIPPIILIMLLLPLPETPYWLIENNESYRAKQALQFFRGENYNITYEYDEIQQKYESKKIQHSKNWWKFTIKKMFSSAFFKPFLCIGILYALNEWLGFGPLMTYIFEIFDETGCSVDPGIGLVIIASIRVVTAGMAPYFIRQFQPKVLFIFGTFSTSVCMVLIGICAYLQEYFPYSPYLEKFSWIPFLSVIVAVIVRATCILPVIYSVMSEVFPTEIRTQSIGLVESFALVCGALIAKFFPEMKHGMELHGLFFFYGATGVISCFYGFLTIPDNRGKSLTKVEEMYEYKNDQEKTANQNQ